MFVIDNNITTRSNEVNQIFRQAKAGGWVNNQQAIIRLQELTEQCIAAGADALEVNIQQYHDLPEAMEFAISANWLTLWSGLIVRKVTYNRSLN